MRYIQLTIVTLLLGLFACSSDDSTLSADLDLTETESSQEPNTREIISTLSIPWELLWGPDDYLWLTERAGLVSRIDPESGEQTIIADLRGSVTQTGESGLLGMALHPNFSEDPYVYLVYTHRTNGRLLERLVRFTFSDITLTDEVILLDNIPAGSRHSGSRIIITPSCHIYMTTGDAGNTSFSQDPNSLAGKLLRLNLDGSIPSDNPDPDSYIYSTGHRNAQGLMLHPNGMIYSAEHGPSTDDEVNIIHAGGNYGWPNVLGTINTADEQAFATNTPVIESIADWTPTIAPSDLMLYSSDLIPEWTDKLLLMSLREQTLFALTLSEDGTEVANIERYFEREFGRLRDAVMAPDGRLFIATNGNSFIDRSPTHRIIEITSIN